MARTVFAALVAFLAAASLAPDRAAAEPYAELAHASNARATDRNLGRNFLHVGWTLADAWRISGGVYIAGEETCFESLTVGRHSSMNRRAVCKSHSSRTKSRSGRWDHCTRPETGAARNSASVSSKL